MELPDAAVLWHPSNGVSRSANGQSSAWIVALNGGIAPGAALLWRH